MVKRRSSAQIPFGLLIGLIVSVALVLYAADFMLRHYFAAGQSRRQEQRILQREGFSDLQGTVPPSTRPPASPASLSASDVSPGTSVAHEYRSSIDSYKDMLHNVQQKQSDSMSALDEAR